MSTQPQPSPETARDDPDEPRLDAVGEALGAWCPGRYALLVDVGYLFAAAGELVLNTTDRRRIVVDTGGLISALVQRARDDLGDNLLRVYWFDGARDRVPTIQQRQVARQPGVKLRLGNVNSSGQQKGVDALIRSDLAELARNKAITDAILLAGDEDMVPAVEDAQAHGVRVHLWGIEPRFGTNQAERLLWEADTVDQLERHALAPHLSAATIAAAAPALAPAGAAPAVGGLERAAGSVTPPAPAAGTRPTPATVASRRPIGTSVPGDASPSRGPGREQMLEVGEHIANKWIATRGRDNMADLLPGPVLPGVIDQELLVAAESEVGTSLRPFPEARAVLRDGFWARIHREFGFSTGVSG